MFQSFSVKYISGMDDKTGKKICRITCKEEKLLFEDRAGGSVAKLQTSSLSDISFSSERTTGGLFRKEKDSPRLSISYTTKSGNSKTIVFEPQDESRCRSVLAPLLATREAAAKRAEHLNGREAKSENIRVRGESYFESSFDALKIANDDYELSKQELFNEGLVDKRIYEFEFSPRNVELRPEPDNPQDPKAIAIWIDGYQVGYVPKGSCAHFHKVLNECEIEKISAKISGGKNKMLLLNEDFDEDEPSAKDYTLERDTAPYYVVVTVDYIK